MIWREETAQCLQLLGARWGDERFVRNNGYLLFAERSSQRYARANQS